MSTAQVLKPSHFLGINTQVKCIHTIDKDRILFCSSNHVIIQEKSSTKQTLLHSNGNVESFIGHVELCNTKQSVAIVVQHNATSSVYIYDVHTLKRTHSLSNKLSLAIKSISFPRRDQLLILGDAPDYLLSLWNLQERVPSPVASIRLATPSGKELRQASMDNNIICVSGKEIIRLFRLVDKVFRPITLNSLKGKPQDYIAHAWSPRGGLVLATKNEFWFFSGDTANLKVRFHCNVSVEWGQTVSVTALAALPSCVIIGGSDGSARLYHYLGSDTDEISLKLTEKLEVDEGYEVIAIDRFQVDNCTMALSDSGRVSTLYLSASDLSESANEPFPSLKKEDIVCIETCNWKPFAVVGLKREIYTWSVGGQREVNRVHSSDEDLVSVALSPTGLHMLICTEKHIELAFLASAHTKTLSMWKTLASNVGSASSFSNGGHLFALVFGEVVQVYNTYTQKLVSSLRGHTGSSRVTALVFKEGDKVIATFGDDGVVNCFEISTGKRQVRVANDDLVYTGGFMSKDFSIALANTSTNEIVAIDLTTKMISNDYYFPQSARLLACKDNVVAIMSTEDSLVGQMWIRNIFEKQTKMTKSSVPLHSKEIHLAAISSEGHFLITGSRDSSLCFSALNQRLFPFRQYQYSEKIGPISLMHELSSDQDLKEVDKTLQGLEQHIKDFEKEEETAIECNRVQYEKQLEDLRNEVKEKERKFTQQVKAKLDESTSLRSELNFKLSTQRKELSEQLSKMTETQAADLEKRNNTMVDLRAYHEKETQKKHLEMDRLRTVHEESLRDLIAEQKCKTENAKAQYASLKEERKMMEDSQVEFTKALELQVELEIHEEEEAFAKSASLSKATQKRYQEEADFEGKRYDILSKDSEELKETISTLEEKELTLNKTVEELKQETAALKSNLQTESSATRDLELNVSSLESEIDILQSQNDRELDLVASLKKELDKKKHQTNDLKLQLESLEKTVKLEEAENDKYRLKLQEKQLLLKAKKKSKEKICQELEELSQEISLTSTRILRSKEFLGDLGSLKSYLLQLSREFNGKARENQQEGNFVEREEKILTKRISSLKDTMKQVNRVTEANKMKLLKERGILEKELNELNVENNILIEKQRNVMK
ncbi:hypothetical protein CTEN210_10008 [Chaetoceros tenuissimus]|uniref:Cilia- and flagella-associated protein 57 n=1 Tax=Chaetoceros tenuissimus TaxID=426638 RepID=A0AAD3CWJ0_9STRA|nr:hypothetical protein CTEN210_10008 [Chaetoceros tenuissimus]